MGEWTIFSNYGHVLVCLARNNEARLRDVAADVGITERAAQKIVKDLQDAGFVSISKHGRCNRYQINKRKSLRHALESQCNVGKLLSLLVKTPSVANRKALDVPESLSAPEPKAASEPKTAPVPKAPAAVPEEVKTRYPSTAEEDALDEKSKKKSQSRSTIDTREQGSLF